MERKIIDGVFDFAANEIKQRQTTRLEADRVRHLADVEDEILGDRQAQTDSEATRHLENNLNRIRQGLAGAMHDPQLGLSVHAEILAAQGTFQELARRLPPAQREEYAHVLDDATQAQKYADSWSELRARTVERSVSDGPVTLTVNSEAAALTLANARYQATWSALSAACAAYDSRLGADAPSAYRAEPLTWSPRERSAEHRGTYARSFVDLVARSQQERLLGEQPVDFAREPSAFELAWLAGTRLSDPAAGRYAVNPEDQQWIDAQWRARGHPDYPAMSDETRLAVLDAACGDLRQPTAEARNRLPDSGPEQSAEAQARRRVVLERASVAMPGDRPTHPLAPRTADYPTDPEAAVVEARRRSEASVSGMQATAGENGLDWYQHRADWAQANIDEARFLNQLGKLPESTRIGLLGQLDQTRSSALRELDDSIESGDLAGQREARTRLGLAERDATDLRDVGALERLQAAARHGTDEQWQQAADDLESADLRQMLALHRDDRLDGNARRHGVAQAEAMKQRVMKQMISANKQNNEPAYIEARAHWEHAERVREELSRGLDGHGQSHSL